MYKRFEIAFSTPEPVDTLRLHRLIGEYLDGYTLQTAEGAWRGTTKHSYVVIVNAGESCAPGILHLARKLKARYEQECVLVTSWDIAQEFI